MSVPSYIDAQRGLLLLLLLLLPLPARYNNVALSAMHAEPGFFCVQVRSQNLITDKHFPREVLVGLNKRNPQARLQNPWMPSPLV